MAIVRRVIAVLVVPVQMLFVMVALVGGAVQGSGYSTVRDDISDLGALTARHPWFELGPEGLAGAMTVAFCLLVLRPVLSWLGAALLAASLMGLDSLSDLVFRLRCVSTDRGCSDAVRLGTWQAQVHAGIGVVSALASVAALLVLARGMRRSPVWEDLARPTQWLAGVLGALLVAYAVLEGQYGGGILERVAVAALVPVFALLARRALPLLEDTPTVEPEDGPAAHRHRARDALRPERAYPRRERAVGP